MKDKRLTHYHMDSTTAYKLNKLIDRKHFLFTFSSILLACEEATRNSESKIFLKYISERKIGKTHSKETEGYVTLQFAFCEKVEQVKLGGRKKIREDHSPRMTKLQR